MRRYHLQKMAFYEQLPKAHPEKKILSVFVMPDSSTYTEKRGDGLIIEHVKAFRFPGNWEYRFLWKQSKIRPILKKYKPQVIEVGSPYLLPTAVRRAARKECPQAALLSFWHADFPVTYVGRPVANKLGSFIGRIAEKIAFWYARQEFKKFDGIQVSCKEVRERLNKNGLESSVLSEKEDIDELKKMIEEFYAETKSKKAEEILQNFEEYIPHFKKIIPNDYQRMLTAISKYEEQGIDYENAVLEAFKEVV